MNTKKPNKRILVFLCMGIIGSVLMATGDWLMMYCDPETLGETVWITKGAAQKPYVRNMISMVIGFPAAIFYVFGMLCFENFFMDGKSATTYRWLATIGFLPWLCIHLYVAAALFHFSWLYNQGYTEIAYESARAIVKQFSPVFYIGVIIMLAPFVYWFYSVVRGRTIFPRLFALTVY